MQDQSAMSSKALGQSFSHQQCRRGITGLRQMPADFTSIGADSKTGQSQVSQIQSNTTTSRRAVVKHYFDVMWIAQVNLAL